jgi:signal transduction histidine kinase
MGTLAFQPPLSPAQLLLAASSFLLIMLVLAGGIAAVASGRLRGGAEERHDDRRDPQIPLKTAENLLLEIKAQQMHIEELERRLKRHGTSELRVWHELLVDLPSGVLLFDRNGMVQQANPAARLALGFASPVGLRASELFRDARVKEDDGSDIGRATDLIGSVLGGGPALQRKNLEYALPDGRWRPLGCTFSPLRRGIEGAGVLCLVTDLTQVKALEQELAQRRSLAALGEMAAGIAHEFKNALATINGYAQMVYMNSGDEEARLHSRRILEQVQAISAITTEFLTFAKPLSVDVQPVDLKRLVQSCIESVGAQNFPGIRLEAAGAFPLVLGDELLLKNVFTNLIRNACEAIQSYGKGGVVRVTAGKEQDGSVEILVSDDGPGVPADIADKIFIPFFTTKASGTGLGLAMVHKIITAHGGNLVLAHSEPSYTVFAVSLPVRETADCAKAASS